MYVFLFDGQMGMLKSIPRPVVLYLHCRLVNIIFKHILCKGKTISLILFPSCCHTEVQSRVGQHAVYKHTVGAHGVQEATVRVYVFAMGSYNVSFMFCCSDQAAVSLLKQEYKEDEMTLPDALKLAIRVLGKTLDVTKLTPDKGKQLESPSSMDSSIFTFQSKKPNCGPHNSILPHFSHQPQFF